MKRLSRYKKRILNFLAALILWAFGATAIAAVWAFEYSWAQALASWLAMTTGGVIGLYVLVNNWIPNAVRTPGYYWVRFDPGDGPIWVPGELLEDGRWWYMRAPWLSEEQDFLEIGKRIER